MSTETKATRAGMTPQPVPDSQRRLPLSVYWLVALSVLVLGVLVVPIPLRGRMLATLFDLTHGPFFATFVAFAVLLATRNRPTGLLKIAICVWLAALVVGTVGEGLQALSQRTPSWYDLVANLLGATSGLLIGLGVRQTARPERTAMLLIAAGLLIASIWSPAHHLIDWMSQKRQFPLIAGCEKPVELSRWHTKHTDIRISQMWSTQGKSSLHVTMHPADYLLLQFQWLPRRNWHTFRYLQFDIMVPHPQRAYLTLKVFDESHRDSWEHDDRFHKQIQLGAIQQTVRVDLDEIRNAPSDREMDLTKISSIEFFLDHPTEPVTFLIDNLRLAD